MSVRHPEWLWPDDVLMFRDLPIWRRWAVRIWGRVRRVWERIDRHLRPRRYAAQCARFYREVTIPNYLHAYIWKDEPEEAGYVGILRGEDYELCCLQGETRSEVADSMEETIQHFTRFGCREDDKSPRSLFFHYTDPDSAEDPPDIMWSQCETTGGTEGDAFTMWATL